MAIKACWPFCGKKAKVGRNPSSGFDNHTKAGAAGAVKLIVGGLRIHIITSDQHFRSSKV